MKNLNLKLKYNQVFSNRNGTKLKPSKLIKKKIGLKF
jgi:hypothetical protein